MFAARTGYGKAGMRDLCSPKWVCGLCSPTTVVVQLAQHVWTSFPLAQSQCFSYPYIVNSLTPHLILYIFHHWDMISYLHHYPIWLLTAPLSTAPLSLGPSTSIAILQELLLLRHVLRAEPGVENTLQALGLMAFSSTSNHEKKHDWTTS